MNDATSISQLHKDIDRLKKELVDALKEHADKEAASAEAYRLLAIALEKSEFDASQLRFIFVEHRDPVIGKLRTEIDDKDRQIRELIEQLRNRGG